MRPTKTNIIGLIVFLFLPFFLPAQEKYSKVKIFAPTDKQKKAELLGLLQIDHCYYSSDGAIIADINQKDIEKLRATSYRFQVTVPDVAKRLDSLNKIYYREIKNKDSKSRVALEYVGGTLNTLIPTPSAFVVQPSFGGYYSFAQMEAAMDILVANYPSLVTKTSLGKSVENRDIWCIKISDNVATDESNEPEVLYMGLQHAREAIGGASMIFFMQYLCENYATNSKIKDLIDNREIFIIPCMNPDGWEYNRNHGGTSGSGNTVNAPGGGWRKNRKLIATGEYGVDLNRNWGVDWGNCAGASTSCGSSSKLSSNETYYGTAAFSEPETQAVRTFVKSHHLVAMIDQHAYGPYYSLPFGRPSLHPQPDSLTVDQQRFYTAIPALMGTYNGMRAGNSIQSVGYEVAGGVKDWMLKGEIGVGTKGVVYGMTGEGGAGGGLGGSYAYSDFWAPAGQIVYLCKGMIYQDLQLAYAAGSYVDLQDVDDIDVASKTGSFDFQIRRLGLGNDPVTITLIPIQNIQSVGSPVTVNSLPNYYDTYSGNISYNLYSSITNGQQIKFAWKVQTGGYTYYDTVVKFYNPTQLFYDDMEGTFSTNWTASSNVSDKWAYTTLSAYQGTHAMTESPGGNYTTSTTRYATANATFNLSDATAAHLTFWVKHRAENYRDRLQVQVSSNGGTSWSIVAGSTTIQEPVTFDDETINGQPALTGIRDYWTKEVYDLSSPTFRTNNVKIRFAFLSDANGSGFDFENDDGFYIDNVKLVKSTAVLITLPLQFSSFTAKLLANNTVKLDWTATTDQIDYFEVEKSADGNWFTSIGTVKKNDVYQFIDKSPFIGTNYYRIKAIDVSGKIVYSKVAGIIYNPSSLMLSIYPNPVADELSVVLKANLPENFIVQITGLNGQTVYKKELSLSNETRKLSVDMDRLSGCVFLVKVTNSKGQVLRIEKIIKR